MKHLPKTLSIKEALREGVVFLRTSSPSFGMDAEILLSEIIKKQREYFLTHSDEKLKYNQVAKYRHWLMLRLKGLPLPYITRHQYFMGRKFIINKYVLVPRPETEAIVEECIKIVKDSVASSPYTLHPYPLVIADIGTGSGVIAVSIAVSIPKSRVIATDKSGTALKIARCNAKKYRVGKRINFFASDLLNEIPAESTPAIIVANLPYVTTDELKRAAKKPDTIGLTFEPQGALDGGPDGLAVFRRFFAQIDRFPRLKDNLRHLLLEHNPKQKQALWQMAHETLPNFKPAEISAFVTHWSR